MNILVTGSSGFVGRNLVENLKNIRDGKDRTRPGIKIDAIYEYDVQNTREELEMFCASADFVFNLAGVNRPKDQTEFMEGNFGFASELLDALRSHGNTAPVMLASSIQATLSGRFGDSEYGRSKKRERRYWSTGSRISLENGAAPITTALWPPSATIWPTAFRSMSAIRPQSWSCFILTIW